MHDNPPKLAYLSGGLRVSTRLEAGASGPRSHVLGVMRAFERLGWDVRPFIVGDRVSVHWVEGEHSAAVVRRSWFSRAAADFVRLGMGWLNGWRAWKEIGSVDWAYERYGAFQALGWWFRQNGVPWILESNDIHFLSATKDRGMSALKKLLKLHERWAYQHCDVLVCISRALAQLLIEETEVDPQKVIVVPNGVDVAHLSPDGQTPHRHFAGTTIGFVGQLQQWQRLDLLLEALAALRTDGVVFNLVVVGDGHMRAAWENLAVRLGLANQAQFVGQVPWSEVPAYIAGFDLGYAGAVPLSAGAMYLSPLKLYEYAAMGKPIIATAYEDARRLSADGVPVYLFGPDQREDLLRTLRQAYAERDRWQEMGRRGREVIVTRHSWEARVRTMIGQIEAILQDKYGTAYPARRRG